IQTCALPIFLRFGATYVNYVGRSLSYILAQPERPEESQTKLRIVFGTEASVHDRAEFERRFHVKPGESYGSSEGAVVIGRTEDTPPNALGVSGAYMSVAILDENGEECPRAEFDADGALANAGEAIGEICNLTGAAMFEGYYRNPEATAERNIGEVYHSGDLGYRDADGFFYFAGRSGDKIRVDSENFSSGPVERILDRFPGVLVVAVYPVPDPRTGDQVMAAIQLEAGVAFDPVAFSEFCRAQPDMGTTWPPRFVRVLEDMPVTATRKISKPSLRRESWTAPGDIYLRGDDGGYRPLTDDDRDALLAEYRLHGRQPAGASGLGRSVSAQHLDLERVAHRPALGGPHGADDVADDLRDKRDHQQDHTDRDADHGEDEDPPDDAHDPQAQVEVERSGGRL